MATIRYQLAGSGPKATRVQLKTAASEKPVPLPSFVTTRLVAHHAAQLRERLAAGVPTDGGLVFVTPQGLPVSNSWLTQHFQDLLAAAGLPKMRLHDLRQRRRQPVAQRRCPPAPSPSSWCGTPPRDDDRDLQPRHHGAGASGGGGAGGGAGGVRPAPRGTGPTRRQPGQCDGATRRVPGWSRSTRVAVRCGHQRTPPAPRRSRLRRAPPRRRPSSRTG